MIEVPDFSAVLSKLSPSDQQQIQRLIEAVRELQAASEAADTTLADHETRIIALEP